MLVAHSLRFALIKFVRLLINISRIWLLFKYIVYLFEWIAASGWLCGSHAALRQRQLMQRRGIETTQFATLLTLARLNEVQRQPNTTQIRSFLPLPQPTSLYMPQQSPNQSKAQKPQSVQNQKGIKQKAKEEKKKAKRSK